MYSRTVHSPATQSLDVQTDSNCKGWELPHLQIFWRIEPSLNKFETDASDGIEYDSSRNSLSARQDNLTNTGTSTGTQFIHYYFKDYYICITPPWLHRRLLEHNYLRYDRILADRNQGRPRSWAWEINVIIIHIIRIRSLLCTAVQRVQSFLDSCNLTRV
jgi:hypothetical protein